MHDDDMEELGASHAFSACSFGFGFVRGTLVASTITHLDQIAPQSVA